MKRKMKFGISLAIIFALLSITTMLSPSVAPPSGPIDPGNGGTPGVDPGDGGLPGFASDNYQGTLVAVEDVDSPDGGCSIYLSYK